MNVPLQVRLKDVVTGALGEGEDGIVVVGHVELPVGLGRGSGEQEVDDTVGDGLAGHIHGVSRDRVEGLGKGELQPVILLGSRDRDHTSTTTSSVVSKSNVVGSRGKTTVDKVPEKTGAGIETGKDLTSIRELDVRGEIPVEGILDSTRRVTITGEPNLDILTLTTTEASEGYRLGSSRVSKRNYNLLLGKLDRVTESMGGHVNTTGKSITLVLEDNLLNLELGRGKGSGDGARGASSNGEDGGNRIDFTGDLDLLGQEIGRERRKLAFGRGDGVREREPNVSKLRRLELSSRASITTEGKDVITSRTVGHLTESILEELLTRKEILGRTTITEAHLLDEGVTPSTRKTKTVGGTGREGSNVEDEDDILDAVVRGNGEGGRATGEVGKLLNVTGVHGGSEALLLGSFRVGVIHIHTLARTDHLLNRFRKRGIHLFELKQRLNFSANESFSLSFNK